MKRFFKLFLHTNSSHEKMFSLTKSTAAFFFGGNFFGFEQINFVVSTKRLEIIRITSTILVCCVEATNKSFC